MPLMPLSAAMLGIRLPPHAAHHLHHLLHLLKLREHAVDICYAGSAALGDAVLARCLQTLGILTLIRRHALDDRLALADGALRAHIVDLAGHLVEAGIIFIMPPSEPIFLIC